MKTICDCGNNCDYEQSTYEKVNGLTCNNSRTGTNYYKIKYSNGDIKIVRANSSLEVIQRYDLATANNINTQVIQLEGEQIAIAISNKA